MQTFECFNLTVFDGCTDAFGIWLFCEAVLIIILAE